jgi:hypothetical protein
MSLFFFTHVSFSFSIVVRSGEGGGGVYRYISFLHKSYLILLHHDKKSFLKFVCSLVSEITPQGV